MKRPFDTLTEEVSKKLNQTFENDNKNFEFLHSFTIWILGFSVGALSLIATNIGDVKATFSYLTIKALIIFLGISIISGIIHRWFLYLYQSLYNANTFYVEAALSNISMMATEPEDVSAEQNIVTLVNLLLTDYGVDDSFIYALYDEADADRKLLIIEAVKKKYVDIGSWAKRDYQIGLDHINEVMATAFGFTQQEMQQHAGTNSNRIRMYRTILGSALLAMFGCFIIAIIIAVLCY